jgi:hypothetical protein
MHNRLLLLLLLPLPLAVHSSTSPPWAEQLHMHLRIGTLYRQVCLGSGRSVAWLRGSWLIHMLFGILCAEGSSAVVALVAAGEHALCCCMCAADIRRSAGEYRMAGRMAVCMPARHITYSLTHSDGHMCEFIHQATMRPSRSSSSIASCTALQSVSHVHPGHATCMCMHTGTALTAHHWPDRGTCEGTEAHKGNMARFPKHCCNIQTTGGSAVFACDGMCVYVVVAVLSC